MKTNWPQIIADVGAKMVERKPYNFHFNSRQWVFLNSLHVLWNCGRHFLDLTRWLFASLSLVQRVGPRWPSCDLGIGVNSRRT